MYDAARQASKRSRGRGASPAAAVPVQRLGPFSRSGRRRLYVLDLAQVHPVIRLAHRMSGPINIPGRIILDHELVLILAGTGRLFLPGRTLCWRPQSLLFLPPFVPHRFITDSDADCAHVAVHFDLAPDVPPAGQGLQQRRPYEVRFPRGLGLPPLTQLPQRHRVLDLMTQVVQEWAAGQPWSVLQAGSLVAQVLVELLRGQAAGRGGTQALAPAVAQRLEMAVQSLRDRPGSDPSVREMARVARLSPTYFRRLFIQWTGYGPKAYLRRQRVDLARRLLADPALSIKEVAARVGFSDQYYFSRTFRQIDGLSPSEFRNLALAGR